MKGKRKIRVPHPVTPELRDAVDRQWPGIALKIWRALDQLVLFNTFFDKDYDGNDTGRLVVTWKMLQSAWGHSVSFRTAFDEIEKCTGIPLNRCTGKKCTYIDKATTIQPDVPADVRNALVRNALAPESEKTVDFATGVKVTARTRQAHRDQIKAEVANARSVALAECKDPETKELLAELGKHSKYIGKKLKPGLTDLLTILPDGLYRHQVAAILNRLNENPMVVYSPATNTRRVFATGLSVHQLPRELRKYTFAYADEDGAGRIFELDIVAAHLAINAKHWGMPKITAMLERARENDMSVWPELLASMGLSMKFKPLVKKCIYSICYGMGRTKLKALFLEGKSEGIRILRGAEEPELWERFVNHPIVKELLAGRRRAIKNLRSSEQPGGPGAYGEWCAVYNENGFDVLATLSQIATSYEQRLMQSVLPVLRRYPKVYVLSYLHDGISVYIGDLARKDCVLRELCKAVEETAMQFGIKTTLEETPLVPESCLDDIHNLLTSIDKQVLQDSPAIVMLDAPAMDVFSAAYMFLNQLKETDNLAAQSWVSQSYTHSVAELCKSFVSGLVFAKESILGMQHKSLNLDDSAMNNLKTVGIPNSAYRVRADDIIQCLAL